MNQRAFIYINEKSSLNNSDRSMIMMCLHILLVYQTNLFIVSCIPITKTYKTVVAIIKISKYAKDGDII